MALSDLTLAAFSLFNLLRLVSYLPQIWCVARRDGNGATAISYFTWTIWIGANGSTAVYALVNLGDPWMATLNALNAMFCTIVLALTFRQRRRWRARSASRLGGALAR